GGATTLSWEATAKSRCTARGAWHGPRSERGTEVVDHIASGAMFELECDGDGGSGVAKVSVRVAPEAAQERTPPPATDDARTHGLVRTGLFASAMLLLLGAFGPRRCRRSARR